MTTNPQPYSLTLTIDGQERLNDVLDRALGQVLQEALKIGETGILVTRHDHRSYTVELSSDVPIGTIAETDALRMT